MQQSMLDFYDQHQTPPIACGEQPQQRFEASGVAVLSAPELIAIMLHTGIRGHSVLGLASQLIAQAGSIAGLASWQPMDFQRLKGIGRAKGRQLAALVEIARSMMAPPTSEPLVFNRPGLVLAHFTPIVRGLEIGNEVDFLQEVHQRVLFVLEQIPKATTSLPSPCVRHRYEQLPQENYLSRRQRFGTFDSIFQTSHTSRTGDTPQNGACGFQRFDHILLDEIHLVRTPPLLASRGLEFRGVELQVGASTKATFQQIEQPAHTRYITDHLPLA